MARMQPPGFPLSYRDRTRCRARILLLAGEGNERDVPASLHRDRDLSLMTGAVAGYAAGKYLPAFRQEEPDGFNVLVIYEGRFVHAEPAYFFSDREPPSLVRASAVPGVPASRIRGPLW